MKYDSVFPVHPTPGAKGAYRGVARLYREHGRLNAALEPALPPGAAVHLVFREGRVLRLPPGGAAVPEAIGLVVSLNGAVAASGGAGLRRGEMDRAVFRVRMELSAGQSTPATRETPADAPCGRSAPSEVARPRPQAVAGACAQTASREVARPRPQAASCEPAKPRPQPPAGAASREVAQSRQQPPAGASPEDVLRRPPVKSRALEEILSRAEALFVPPDGRAESFVPRPFAGAAEVPFEPPAAFTPCEPPASLPAPIPSACTVRRPCRRGRKR